jgi:hypothetical protein
VARLGRQRLTGNPQDLVFIVDAKGNFGPTTAGLAVIGPTLNPRGVDRLSKITLLVITKAGHFFDRPLAVTSATIRRIASALLGMSGCCLRQSSTIAMRASFTFI